MIRAYEGPVGKDYHVLVKVGTNISFHVGLEKDEMWRSIHDTVCGVPAFQVDGLPDLRYRRYQSRVIYDSGRTDVVSVYDQVLRGTEVVLDVRDGHET